jgi:FtsZ-binding cell division protein ZapB
LRFSEVLPYLEAGRRAKWGIWEYRFSGVNSDLEYLRTDGTWAPLPTAPSRDFLTDDEWTLAEEPAPAKPRGNCPHVSHSEMLCILSQPDGATGGYMCDCACHATIARLTRELEAERKCRDDLMAGQRLDDKAHANLCGEIEDLREQVARLTRERDEARAHALEHTRDVERLTVEHAGLKAAYDELRAVAENNADILAKIDAVVKAHS